MELFCVNGCATLHKLHKPVQNLHKHGGKIQQTALKCLFFIFCTIKKAGRNGAKNGQKSIKKRPFLTFKAVQNAG